MDDRTKADHSISGLVVALTAMVFVLDLMTPLGITIWALDVLPLGLTRWPPLGPLTFIVAGACAALIVLGYLFSPPGTSPDVAIFNRMVYSWCGSQHLSSRSGGCRRNLRYSTIR